MEGNYLELFEIFWSHYPKWRKIKKKRALLAFKKIRVTDDLLMKMIDTLEWQKLDWVKIDPCFTPHASTWLSDERWTDEKPPEPSRSGLLPPRVVVEGEWLKLWKEKNERAN